MEIQEFCGGKAKVVRQVRGLLSLGPKVAAGDSVQFSCHWCSNLVSQLEAQKQRSKI